MAGLTLPVRIATQKENTEEPTPSTREDVLRSKSEPVKEDTLPDAAKLRMLGEDTPVSAQVPSLNSTPVIPGSAGVQEFGQLGEQPFVPIDMSYKPK